MSALASRAVAAVENKPISEPVRIDDPRAAWICRAAIVLAIVGVFGTWRVAGAVTLDGVGGPHDGWLVIIFGLIALAGVGALARGSWFGIITIGGAATAMISAPLQDLLHDNSVLGGRSGWGLWLTVAASVVLAAAAVRTAVRRIRPQPAPAS
jgi:hypothetical protein